MCVLFKIPKITLEIATHDQIKQHDGLYNLLNLFYIEMN